MRLRDRAALLCRGKFFYSFIVLALFVSAIVKLAICPSTLEFTIRQHPYANQVVAKLGDTQWCSWENISVCYPSPCDFITSRHLTNSRDSSGIIPFNTRARLKEGGIHWFDSPDNTRAMWAHNCLDLQCLSPELFPFSLTLWQFLHGKGFRVNFGWGSPPIFAKVFGRTSFFDFDQRQHV